MARKGGTQEEKRDLFRMYAFFQCKYLTNEVHFHLRSFLRAAGFLDAFPHLYVWFWWFGSSEKGEISMPFSLPDTGLGLVER